MKNSVQADPPAALVFTGHVVQAKAATMPEISADDTAIVAVDDVVTAPPMFSAIAGTQITVRFGNLTIPRVGSVRTFHTRGWMYGQGLAVDAVQIDQEQPKQAVTESLRTAHVEASDGALADRLSTAHLGVVGEVTAVRPLEVATTHISEHDPAWHEATIKVDEVVKGSKRTREVNVVFPQSDDVRWHQVPKYHPGQQGIWLLHRASTAATRTLAPKAAAALPALGANALTAIDAADFLPLGELGRVKALLNN